MDKGDCGPFEPLKISTACLYDMRLALITEEESSSQHYSGCLGRDLPQTQAKKYLDLATSIDSNR